MVAGPRVARAARTAPAPRSTIGGRPHMSGLRLRRRTGGWRVV